MRDKSARLGTEKVGKLLLDLSLPATIGMLVNALYNIVDTIFIGQGVDALAIGGLAIAFPIQMIVMAFALMIGLGASSAVSRSLGAGDIERVDYVTGNSFLAILVLSTITVILGFTYVEPLLRLFGATDTLLPYARDYITVIFIGSVFFSFTVSTNNLVRAEGNAKVSMYTMILGTGLNIILDPVFIFGFDLGISGAAWATIVSQFVSFIYILMYIYRGNSTLKVKLHHFAPRWEILREIFAVGSAAFSRQVSGSLVAIVLNNSLKIYGGDTAITILGIVNRSVAFVIMPLFGVIQGMQPIVGFNYGARKLQRVTEVVKLAVITSTLVASIGWAITELFPFLVIGVFTREPEIIRQGAQVLRIVFALLPIIGVQIVGAALFQALGLALPSLILSLLRQVLLFVPLVLILPRVYGLGLLGIWLAFPLADLMSTVITAILLNRQMQVIKTAPNPVTE